MSESDADYALSLGRRIQVARETIGLTQDELAERIGFGSRQIVSDLERGVRSVKAAELVRIARVLHTDVSALLASAEPVASSVLWRSAPERGTNEVRSEFLMWCERYAQLVRLLRVKHDELVPSFEADLATMRFSDAERMAHTLSDMLDLGLRPAAVLHDALENRLGILVWYLETGSESAAACAKGDFGNAILVPRSSAPWRRNFDIAHEVFHLVTWRASAQLQDDGWLSKRAERLANCFAAALLMPEKPLLQDLDDRLIDGSIDVRDLIGMARDYGVSTDALLWRLLNLGRLPGPDEVRSLLENPDFRRLDRLSKEGRWTEPPQLPDRFLALACRAAAHGRLSRSVLAEYLACGLPELPSRLSELGVVDPALCDDVEPDAPRAETVDKQERCDDPESSPLCFA